MPRIQPVSDLRSYNDVLSNVQVGSPVFLTRNGHGRYAILDIADYDRLSAASSLFNELEAGRASGERDGWLSMDNIRSRFSDREVTHA